MKAISKNATKVMDKLTEGLDSEDSHRRIDNDPSFMAVVVEWVGSVALGPLFSIAHYGEQNGDLMRDPDVVFVKGPDGLYYPVSYRNDYLGLDQTAIEFDDQTTVEGYRPKLQASIARFVGDWMRNIKLQQGV